MMSQKLKTASRLILTGISILIISALLTLAINQARTLIGLYTASVAASSTIGGSELMRPSMRLGNQALILVSVAAVLFLLVVRRPDRLLPVLIMAVLVFIGLNLYSGRHVLPQLLIWPAPAWLSEQYVQALAADDVEAALRLTDQSAACQTIMAAVFQDHQAQLKQSVADDLAGSDIGDTSVKRIQTFYEQPVPQGFVIMQPVPQQLVYIMARTENGGTVWLNLKMRYTPFWGTRYICGQGRTGNVKRET